MKKFIVSFVAVLAVSIALVSWNNRHAVRPDGAVHIDINACGVIDGNGNFYLSTDGNAVITPSGNDKLQCKASGAPNATGHAVNYNGFLCNTPTGLTTDSRETVSASGNVTLTCRTSN